MDNKRMEYIRYIFATSILLTRKWEVLLNRTYQRDDLTLKQFMLLIVLGNAFDHDPTIKEIASTLTTSHQNVKGLLMQLEKKQFIHMYTDPKDKRIIRVRVAEGKEAYWEERDKTDREILISLFKEIPLEDLAVTCKTILKLDEIAATHINF